MSTLLIRPKCVRLNAKSRMSQIVSNVSQNVTLFYGMLEKHICFRLTGSVNLQIQLSLAAGRFIS